MVPVLLLGAGKIGGAIGRLLAGCGDYDVCIGDVSDVALARLPQSMPNLTTVRMDVANAAALRSAMKERRIVVSACSFDVNVGIAQAALDTGLSYFDLTEDVNTTVEVQRIAKTARPGQVFVQQAGDIGILGGGIGRGQKPGAGNCSQRDREDPLHHSIPFTASARERGRSANLAESPARRSAASGGS